MAGFPRSITLVAFDALTALSVSACAGVSPSPSPSATQSSGVRGVSMVVAGLSRTPVPQPNVRIAVHESDLAGAVVAMTTADAHGAFKVDLTPGRYTIVQVFGGAVPKTVTIRPGQYASVKLIIQGK